MTDSCRFCEILEKKEGIIFEDEFFYAQFDAYPITPGHAEIVPKRHIASLFDLSSDEWNNLFVSIKSVITVVESAELTKEYNRILQTFGQNKKVDEYCNRILNHIGISKKPDGYNFGINEGKAAGRTIDHLHLHIIPRHFGDIADATGGVRNIIPGLGNYKK